MKFRDAKRYEKAGLAVLCLHGGAWDFGVIKAAMFS